MSKSKNALLVLFLIFAMNNNTAYKTSAQTIYEANQSTGDRSYSVSNSTEYIDQSLGTTGFGVLNISGTGPDSTISGKINGGSTQGHLFKLTSSSPTTLNLSNVTISDALRSNSGGGVITLSNGNTVNITSVTIKNNSSFSSGGAINSSDGNIYIKDSLFDTNKSTNSSGGAIVIYGTNGKTVIDNTTFQNNSAVNTGAIFISQSDLILTNSNFINNQSNTTVTGSSPGAVRLGSGSAKSMIDNCLFEDNISGSNAGAIYSYGTATITNTTFRNNYASFRGGALVVANNSTANISGSYFQNNSSQEFAGAIYNDGNLIIDNTVISENRALHHETSLQDGRGGAIYNSSVGIITLNQGTIIRNNSSAGEGGGLANSSRGIIYINGAVFDSNTADADGGAFWNTGTATVSGNSGFINNTSSASGGAVYNSGRLDLTSDSNGNIIFQNNISSIGDNDIHTIRELNINGDTNTVLINGGISGSGVVNKYNNGNLILHGDSSNYTGTFNQDGGTTYFSDGKWFSGDSNILDGLLEWGTNALKTGGTIDISGGSLYVHPDAVMDLNNTADTISPNAVIYLDKSALINNSGTVTFNQGDVWLGKVNNTGSVTMDNINANSGSFSQTSGHLYMHNNSELTTNSDTLIRGGDMTMDSGSIMNIADNYFLVNNLTMDNAAINALNGITGTNYIANTFDVKPGGANFSIDFDGDRKVADQFIANNYTGNGTISIDNYNVLGAPSEKRIPFPVFTGSGVEGMNFAATNDIVNTPLYRYNLRSEGRGIYSLIRGELNPSVNRGAESVEAMFLNNIGVINMIFEHVYIDSEQYKYLRNPRGGNYSVYTPYQNINHEEGSIWFKPYVSYDRFSLHNNNMVYNTSYGSILGFDFPTQNIGDGWKFLPTSFITYQGARQSSNGNNYYQNGGMGGLMGTVFKGDFISSILAYGGGYSNEMQGYGYNDRVGNWYAGAAGIGAYNFHPKKNIIVQPMVWTMYNILGRQSWTSSFGNVPFTTGYLNGLAVSPCLNTFYGNEKWSFYTTVGYVFTINDHVKATAGPVRVDSARLRYGFLQYGVGFIRTWKDRFLAYGQITLQQGGFTGVAFWGGLAYRF